MRFYQYFYFFYFKKKKLHNRFCYSCMSYDNYNSTHHRQGCIDPNNKFISVYLIVTHVVTPLSSQCDIIDLSHGTLTSHCDVIQKVLQFEVRSPSFLQLTKTATVQSLYSKSLFSSDESPFVTKPARIPHYGSHHLNGCSAFVPVLLCLVHQPTLLLHNYHDYCIMFIIKFIVRPQLSDLQFLKIASKCTRLHLFLFDLPNNMNNQQFFFYFKFLLKFKTGAALAWLNIKNVRKQF